MLFFAIVTIVIIVVAFCLMSKTTTTNNSRNTSDGVTQTHNNKGGNVMNSILHSLITRAVGSQLLGFLLLSVTICILHIGAEVVSSATLVNIGLVSLVLLGLVGMYTMEVSSTWTNYRIDGREGGTHVSPAAPIHDGLVVIAPLHATAVKTWWRKAISFTLPILLLLVGCGDGDHEFRSSLLMNQGYPTYCQRDGNGDGWYTLLEGAEIIYSKELGPCPTCIKIGVVPVYMQGTDTTPDLYKEGGIGGMDDILSTFVIAGLLLALLFPMKPKDKKSHTFRVWEWITIGLAVTVGASLFLEIMVLFTKLIVAVQLAAVPLLGLKGGNKMKPTISPFRSAEEIQSDMNLVNKKMEERLLVLERFRAILTYKLVKLSSKINWKELSKTLAFNKFITVKEHAETVELDKSLTDYLSKDNVYLEQIYLSSYRTYSSLEEDDKALRAEASESKSEHQKELSVILNGIGGMYFCNKDKKMEAIIKK